MKETKKISAKLSFKLDEVEVAKTLLAESSYKDAVEYKIGYEIEDCSYNNQTLIKTKKHPFIETLFLAFSQHRPLILTPDIIWLLICQGFSEHITMHSEYLRNKIVNHSNKIKIKIQRDDFVKGKKNPWNEVISQFSSEINKYLKSDIYNLIIQKFSTTSNIEKTAFEVSLLESVKDFFEYEMYSICGIPEVIIEGIESDWLSIKKSLAIISSFELEWWTNLLEPIIDKIIDTVRGDVDLSFWKGIFKYIPPGKDSGAVPYINGWCIKFFPYTISNDNVERNNFIESDFNYKSGLEFVNFPNGLSHAPFKWYYLGDQIDMEFCSGFVGVRQSRENKQLKAEIGWAVRDMNSRSIERDFEYEFSIYRDNMDFTFKQNTDNSGIMEKLKAKVRKWLS